MSDAVFIALIVGFFGFVGPWLLKRQDYKRQDAVIAAAEQRAHEIDARQDLVAAQTAEAAQLLLGQQTAIREQAAEAARLLVQSDAERAEVAEVTIAKLDDIHTLVNSNMTSAMQGELDATVAMLVLMKEVVTLRKDAGKRTSASSAAAIKAAETKIAELRAQLEDRLKQTKIVEARAARSKGDKK